MPKTIASLSIKQIGRAIIVVLLRCLVLLAFVFVALLVALLPITTAVPTFLAILFAIADVALVIALFRFKWAWRAVSVATAGVVLIVLLVIVLSQVFAATPPIAGSNSIATLEKVNLNGSEQWITIRGKNVNNPVLLNLGMGGPGGGGFTTRSLFEPLEDRFVVVSWDEPGTGKSYNAVPMQTLTPQRFIADAHALTQMLRSRFHQDKIYIYGVSWTSILGIWLVQQYPDLYYAFISNGQMVNTTENDVMGYELALKYETERGDTAMLETLRRNGPPPYSGDEMLGKYVATLDVLNDYMNSPHYMVVVPIVPFLAPEYGLVDKVNHTRGLVDSFTIVYPQLRDLDFVTQAPKLNVPVYFFVGRHDVNAMSSLAERYYGVLKAPHKELIWLDSGHGLEDASLGQFVDVMVNHVLADTYPQRQVK